MESLIKKLFRKNELEEEDEEEEDGNMNRMRLEYEDPVLWDAHIDIIKRRMSKLRGDSQPSQHHAIVSNCLSTLDSVDVEMSPPGSCLS